MKKKILALATVGLALLSVQTSLADVCSMDGWYAAASGSVSWHNNTNLNHFTNIRYKTGYGGNASFGYIIDSCWRLEIEGVFRYYNNSHVHNKVESSRLTNNGHLREIFGFLNLVYDIPIADCLDLYLGGGAGLCKARLRLRDRTSPEITKNDGIKFAYQFLGGFAYDINDCWALTLGYRYLAMAKPSFDIRGNGHNSKVRKIPFSNNVDLGLRFKF